MRQLGADGEEANAMVCKIIMRRFESGSALHFYANNCPGGGIGRRTGLKIPRPQRPYRFDPGLGHHFRLPTPALQAGF